LCSHILSEVEDICDRVAIIKRGKLISQGTLGEIVGLQGGYEITFSDDSGSALTRLRMIGFEVMESEDCLKISTRDEQSGEIAVDALRASGGILKEFAPKARTLEDVFFNAVNSMD